MPDDESFRTTDPQAGGYCCPGPSGAPVAQPLPRPIPNGSTPWYVGLIALTMIPGISAIIASLVMIGMGLSQRKDVEPARTNALKAVNWGLTYMLATVVLLAIQFYILSGIQSSTDPLIGTALFLWLLISLFHVIYCPVAGKRAAKGRRVGFCGIPFLRTR